MRSTSALVAFLTLLAGGFRVACSAAKGLPAEVRAALKDPTGFQLHAHVSDIPNSVRLAFAKLAKQETFSMAEPGARWQLTDVMHEPGLPYHRLLKVALSKSLCILFYERGGIAHTYQVAVFQFAQDGAKIVWAGYSAQPIDDPAGLLTGIDQGKINEGVQHF